MRTLENDRLVFRFPQIEEDAQFSIDFQRTLRIPDTDAAYHLSPGLGCFPLRHVEDYAEALSSQTISRGGIILPMWQSEAMWLNFSNRGPDFDLDFPVAIKVAAGKINAVTGDHWRPGLHRDPQDYMMSPRQPWLDGFAVEKGVVRQFVAMPLGEGYSVEEQLTGEPEWGGLQISVVPLKMDVWKEKRRQWKERSPLRAHRLAMFMEAPVSSKKAKPMMGLGAGGRMKQVIYPDTFDINDWDVTAAERVFVTLANANDWKSITGEAALNHPPTAQDYALAGLPWFDYYGADQTALPGSNKLSGVTSVASMFKHKTGATLPHSQDVKTPAPKPVGPGKPSGRHISNPIDWE